MFQISGFERSVSGVLQLRLWVLEFCPLALQLLHVAETPPVPCVSGSMLQMRLAKDERVIKSAIDMGRRQPGTSMAPISSMPL